MKEQIHAIRAIRGQYQAVLAHHSTAQINHIPQGFNNNLIWNAAHIISVQQMIVYGLAGHQWILDKDQVKAFKKDTKPEQNYNPFFIEQISVQLISTIDRMEEDIEADIFKTYTPFMPSMGYEVKNLEQALTFILFHDSLHMGHMINLRKFL
jgi:hypothetical protein